MESYSLNTHNTAPGMDIKDCQTAWDNWKYLSDNWTSHSPCPTGQVKFESSFS